MLGLPKSAVPGPNAWRSPLEATELAIESMCQKIVHSRLNKLRQKSEQRAPLVTSTQSKRKMCPNPLCPPGPTHSVVLLQRLDLHYKACIKSHTPKH